MSRYGFNSNELRKTIVTKIDKDGFHKRDIYDGNADGGSSDFSLATMTVSGNTNINVSLVIVQEADDGFPAYVINSDAATVKPGDEIAIPLYKGRAEIRIIDTNLDPAVSGNASLRLDGSVEVTGDFSLWCE